MTLVESCSEILLVIALAVVMSFVLSFPPSPQPLAADGRPSPSLVLQEVSFCYEDVFPSYCYQVLAHRGSSDC